MKKAAPGAAFFCNAVYRYLVVLVPLEPLVPVDVPVPAPEPMPVLPEPVLLPEPMLELPGVVVLGLVLEPELDVPLALSRRHWSFWVPVSRSQFCVLLPEVLLEELLGDVVLVLGEVVLLLELGEELDPAVLLGEVVLLEPLVLGVALVLLEPTLEPDEPMLPLDDDWANAAAESASSAALTAAPRTFTIMLVLLRRIWGITAAAPQQALCLGAEASA